MSHKSLNETSMPRWLVRRWRLLKGILSNPAFIEAVTSLSQEYKSNDGLPTESCFKAIRDFNIPGDCAPAVWMLLEHPELLDTPQELIQCIKPPVEYVSYKAKVRGQAENPAKAFKLVEQKRQELMEKGVDLISEYDGIYLEVSAYTTKEELTGFIMDVFDNELKPLLQTGEGYFTPPPLRAGRIRVPSKMKARILALHKAGKTPKEIERALGYRHWASNISKVISEAKKSN